MYAFSHPGRVQTKRFSVRDGVVDAAREGVLDLDFAFPSRLAADVGRDGVRVGVRGSAADPVPAASFDSDLREALDARDSVDDATDSAGDGERDCDNRSMARTAAERTERSGRGAATSADAIAIVVRRFQLVWRMVLF